ncbi:phosphate/phosphite/phosphonate ABC transporter substrate-binding protein [Lysinibacillus yapensis]|nr:phosphate/phosphite/phosphonate ABC transporter substrate-binding protein [Lysinibacillus yapensis]
MVFRKFILLVLLVGAFSILSGCKEEADSLTIGFIPLKEKEVMLEEYKPIQNYLEENLDFPVNIEIMDNYANLVKGMENESIDIGYFGAFSYIAAESQMPLTPLIVEERKVTGIYYQSFIISRSDSNLKTIDDLKGKKFAFVDSGSTSGFVLPYALFKSRSIEMDNYFSGIHYSGSHVGVLEDLKNSIVDAGAISSIQYEQLLEDGEIREEDYTIIWESPEIPGSPYVARSELDQKLQENFVEAMLTIHQEIPDELSQYDRSLEKFVKIENKDYNSIRNISTILGKEYMVNYFLQDK